MEGESIQVPAHLRQPCIWCKCQNHQVVCQKRSPCPVECLNQTKSDSHCEHNVLQTSSSLSLSRLQLNVSASSLASSKTLQIKPLFGECVLSSIESRYFITNYDGSRFRFGNRFRCNHLFSRTCRPIDVASIVSPTNHGQPSLITMPDIQFSVQLHNSRSAFGRQVVQRNGSLNESVVLPFDLLLIHLDSVRIEVDSQLQARVNNETIRLPFVRLGVFTVAATHSNTVTIRITNGPRIIWSASKVSVRVPNRLRNQMCGLCGNFNHQIGDDFRSQSGRPLFRSKAFFSEWMVIEFYLTNQYFVQPF